MPVRYFKRYKMAIALYDAPPEPTLPEGYYWVPWDPALLGIHADVKYRSFVQTIDANVFPSLGDCQGCRNLMTEIVSRRGFLPEATWLVACGSGCCGTVQGVQERVGLGAIQNLGVVPLHRGQGIGSALLLKALHGFRRRGLGRVFLEVTAQNESAVQMYRRLGFRARKTLYRAVSKADLRFAGPGTGPCGRDPAGTVAAALGNL